MYYIDIILSLIIMVFFEFECIRYNIWKVLMIDIV